METSNNMNQDQAVQETIRKLATVQVVAEINPHFNADKLEVARVLGWLVVIKKDEVKVGDKIVYFEIDSILPETEWSEFLKEKKYRVKTIKLRGHISQGLILPLNIIGGDVNPENYSVGQDVTKVLGVKKFLSESELATEFRLSSGKVIKVSTFPSDLIEKSDEPRIQSEPHVIREFTGKAYCATLKYDGTSATYLIDPENPEEFYICSRNLRREYVAVAEDPYSFIADKYQIREKLLEENCRYAIQGEIYGPKVAKNLLGVKDLMLAVFNAKDLKENRYLDYADLETLCKKLNLPMVQLIEKGDYFNYTVDQLKELSKGFYPDTKNVREGLVFRLSKDWHSSGRKSFKIINDEFLHKNQ
jgi:RNA ligase (TIGR02306 family)